jgi:hypothetical protein
MHADPADLLEHRLTFLERLIQERRILGVYDAAAAIRQLLIDQHPLVTVVNRQRRIPIKFEVNEIPSYLTERLEEEHRVLYLGPALSPTRSNLGAGTRLLNRDQFLQVPVLLTAWRSVTVRNFVKFAANKAGGVHFDETVDETTESLNALMRAVDNEDFPVFANTMATIAEITVRGLQPLREQIWKERG